MFKITRTSFWTIQVASESADQYDQLIACVAKGGRFRQTFRMPLDPIWDFVWGIEWCDDYYYDHYYHHYYHYYHR
jgi:hypothetical protein